MARRNGEWFRTNIRVDAPSVLLHGESISHGECCVTLEVKSQGRRVGDVLSDKN